MEFHSKNTSAKSSAPPPLKRPKVPIFTVEECPSCSLKTKRAFQTGDYVFKEAGECSSCKTKTRITMIFAEALKPS